MSKRKREIKWVVKFDFYYSPETEEDPAICEGEVAVVKSNNRHGIMSFGWGDPDEKIIIAESCGEEGGWSEKKKAKLLERAVKIAAALNGDGEKVHVLTEEEMRNGRITSKA